MIRWVTLLLVFLASAGVSFADEYASVTASKGPFSPVYAPYAGQKKYPTSPAYKAFQSYTQGLERQVRKGKKYNSATLVRSTRQKIADRITSNNQVISGNRTAAFQAIHNAAVSRTQTIAYAARNDYYAVTKTLTPAYNKAVKKIMTARNKQLIRVLKATKKKYNTAYKKSERQRLYKNLRAAQKNINARAHSSIERTRAYVTKGADISREKLYKRLEMRTLRVQVTKSIAYLNKRTSNQVEKLRAMRVRAIGALKKLSTKSFTEIKTVNTYSSYPETPAVVDSTKKNLVIKTYRLPGWPSLAVPARYTISKNYVSPRAAAYVRKQAAKARARLKAAVQKACVIGRDQNIAEKRAVAYSKRIRSESGARERVKKTSARVATATKAVRKAEQRLSYETIIRLEKPNDSDYVRAKKRYNEAKHALVVAKQNYRLASANLTDIKSNNSDARSKASYYRGQSKALHSRLKAIVSSGKVRKAVNNACPASLS